MRSKRLFRLLSAGVLVAALPVAALAADEAPPPPAAETYPYIDGELGLEVGVDHVFDSDDDGAEITDLFFEGELAVKFGLTPIFSVNLGVTAESVLDPEPFEDRAFRDIGAYVDTLNLAAELGAFTIFGGKFGPGFGTAWDVTPGIYGADFAEDYEITEQIGVGAAYTFDAGDMGKHTLGANVFFADTSFLSDSLFTSRGRLSRGDGGLTNTGELNNVSVTLDGEAIAALPGLTYHLGYRHLSSDFEDETDEDGYVAGLTHTTEMANGVTLGLTGEIAYFSDFAGSRGDDAVYTTAGLSIAREPWHGELAGTVRKLDFGADDDFTDYLVQVSAGYEFENGIDISLGYANVRAEDVDAHVVGVRLSKAFAFSTR